MAGEISVFLKVGIMNALAKGPLKAGEVRGISNLPRHFFGLCDTHNGREAEFSATIGQCLVYVFENPEP